MKKILTLILTVIAMSAAAQGFHFDSSNPDVHDPVMAKGEDGRYYIFSTGMGVGVMSSADLKEWRPEKSVFTVAYQREQQQEGNARRRSPKIDWENSTLPRWTVDSVRGYSGHTWAPDISYSNGKWHLYYSCSTFGKNGSAIGLATNKTLDPTSPDFKWEDQGCVVVSHQHKDNWNAIDPNLIRVKGKKTPYLTWGSFWDGIQLAKLGKDMKTLQTAPKTIARRLGRKLTLAEVDDESAWTIEGGDTIEAGENAIEAPFIIYNKGYYYLFVSHDYCCRGKNSTYKTVYGRSKNVEGPYLDREGKDMAYGGGTLLAGPDDTNFGIGHNSAYCFDGQWYFLSHAYIIKDNGRAKLYLRPFSFTKDGWIEMSH